MEEYECLELMYDLSQTILVIQFGINLLHTRYIVD